MTAGDNDDIERLRAEFEELRGDVATLGEDLRRLIALQTEKARDTVQERVAEAAEELGETLTDDLEHLRRKAEELRECGERAARDLAREVERHPLASVGLAFGIGYLLARLSGRSPG